MVSDFIIIATYKYCWSQTVLVTNNNNLLPDSSVGPGFYTKLS